MSFARSKMRVFLPLVLTVSLLAAGFGAQAADEVIVLKVLNYFDATVAGADREINEIWGAFEKANPGIKIIREDLYQEPFHQKVEAYAAAGQLPDVMYMWPGGRSATLYDKKLVKDLRPLLGETAKEFVPAALVPQRGGILGEIPIGITATHVMYVNKKMLADMKLDVPKTYNDLKAIAKKMKAAAKDTVVMGYQDDWVGQSCLFSMIVGRMCGDGFIDACLAGKAKFTDRTFVNALKFYADLYKDGILSKKVLQTGYGEAPGLFASGRAPFMIDGDWRVGAFLTDPTTKQALIPPKDQPNYLMTIFPRIPGEKYHETTSVVPGVGFGMNANIPAGSAKEKAAWKLIMWLVSPEVQRIRLETGAAFPSRIGVTSDKLEPLAKERARFYGQFKGTYVLDDVLDPKVYSPINIGLQEIGMGISTPEKVAANVQKALETWRASTR